MKKLILLISLIPFLIAGCAATDEKSPLEGAWRLVYAEWQGLDLSFPEQVTGSSIKFWSKDHFAYASQLQLDDVAIHYLGAGTYTLEGNRYIEHIEYHRSEDILGSKIYILLEIDGDTITQRFPANENWELTEYHQVQKYVRID